MPQVPVTSPSSLVSHVPDDKDLTLFERLGTLCSHSNFDLASCRSSSRSNLVSAVLNTTPAHKNCDTMICSDTNTYLVAAMNATGLIPVNVEGKGDCFFIAFWYGFSGGDLASFEQCLELRRMVAKVFLSKCERDSEFVPILRAHDSFSSMIPQSDDAFIEDVFRKLGNFAKDNYPDYIPDFAISYLSEALAVNIWVWQVSTSGEMWAIQIGDVEDKDAPVVHVLYNGRDHYFAFSDQTATSTSVPLDCEFILLHLF